MANYGDTDVFRSQLKTKVLYYLFYNQEGEVTSACSHERLFKIRKTPNVGGCKLSICCFYIDTCLTTIDVCSMQTLPCLEIYCQKGVGGSSTFNCQLTLLTLKLFVHRNTHIHTNTHHRHRHTNSLSWWRGQAQNKLE